MSPQPTREGRIAAVDPAGVHQALIWAASHSDQRQFTARLFADRLGLPVTPMAGALDILVDLGLLGRWRTTSRTLYTVARLPALDAARRPATAAISRRELWAALTATTRIASTLDGIATVLDAPAAEVDRSWLALRLVTWRAAGLLATTSDGRWIVTVRGAEAARAARSAPPRDGEVWAAVAAEQPPGTADDRVDWVAVGRRLGLTAPLLEPWAGGAADRGLTANRANKPQTYMPILIPTSKLCIVMDRTEPTGRRGTAEVPIFVANNRPHEAGFPRNGRPGKAECVEPEGGSLFGEGQQVPSGPITRSP
ncbi:hypothetical protein [Frankia sp. AgB32]|uniref:hypothetical protein n=1 Tax=Frankia sp. AgB32 TaxID=631119 RepID=UPI0020104E45|nr:hypothetical protein [Frankia sp. AgB32]MCK9898287.1 hypothetical protein [Frankia sp. AgB32]